MRAFKLAQFLRVTPQVMQEAMADTGCRHRVVSGRLSVLDIGRIVKHLAMPKWAGVFGEGGLITGQFSVRAEDETAAKQVGYDMAHEKGLPPEKVRVEVWVIDETRA